MENLVWKVIQDFDEYEISNLGNIRRSVAAKSNCTFKGKIMKCNMNTRGYLMAHLYKDGVRFSKTVHRLVAKAFIPNSDHSLEINHMDGVKTNNNFLNLEWCSHKNNMNHAEKKLRIYKPRGEKHGMSKLNNKIVKEIRLSYPRKSMKELAIKYGVTPSTIERVVNRKTWL